MRQTFSYKRTHRQVYIQPVVYKCFINAYECCYDPKAVNEQAIDQSRTHSTVQRSLYPSLKIWRHTSSSWNMPDPVCVCVNINMILVSFLKTNPNTLGIFTRNPPESSKINQLWWNWYTVLNPTKAASGVWWIWYTWLHALFAGLYCGVLNPPKAAGGVWWI